MEEAARHGRKLRFGEGVGYVRGVSCLEDGAKAIAIDAAACDKVWGEWFAGTGFTNAFALPGEPIPIRYTYDLIRDRGFAFSGSPDQVSRMLEAHQKNTESEFFFIHVNTGATPRDVLRESLETFAEKVLPRFDFEPLA
jgi:alkanesulfonate monooxygenase SsuD/methylene tetrahydromethanopterin reductase-like flavin-dependent oxidoreductase (luciferase family)